MQLTFPFLFPFPFFPFFCVAFFFWTFAPGATLFLASAEFLNFFAAAAAILAPSFCCPIR